MKILKKTLSFFLLAGLTLCCSVDEIKQEVAYNAHISCQSNDSCTATCYKGYLFPVGKTEESFTCRNNSWIPKPLSCKRKPVVVVGYYTAYHLQNMPVSSCENISRYLINLKEKLEIQFSKLCEQLKVDMTTNFSFSPLAFLLRIKFDTKYTNASDINSLNVCIETTRIIFENRLVPALENLLDNITCGNLELNYTFSGKLNKTIGHKICYNNTFVQNVTVMIGDKRRTEYYCDSLNTLPTEPSMTRSSVETVPKLEFTESTNYRITEISTMEYITSVNIRFSTSSSNGPLLKSSQDKFGTKQIIYIAVPAGGCLVLIIIVIAIIVCRSHRTDTPNKEAEEKTSHSQKDQECIEINDAEEKGNMSKFRGEMIENELYQSADEDYKDNINNEDTNIITSILYSSVSGISEKDFNQPIFREKEEMKEDYLYSEVKRSKQNDDK